MSRCFDMVEFRDCEGAYLNHTCITSGTPAWEEVLSFFGLLFVICFKVLSNTTRWYGWKTEDGDACIFTSSNGTCDTSPGASLTITQPFSLPPDMRQTSSQLYFEKEVLRASASLNELGTPSWWMTLCIGVTWIVNFLCLFKGIKTSGKVVYFTATFPYVILTILLVKAATLPGSSKVIN